MIKIIKTKQCPSLSGKTTLTYQIGRLEQKIYLRLKENSNGGFFCKEWITVEHLRAEDQKPISSDSIQALFKGKSANPDTKLPLVQMHRAWDNARKAAGLPDVRMHDLRHSMASNMVNSGRSIYEVAKVLGHSQLKTTQRYAHLSQETLLAAVDAAASNVPWVPAES